MSTNELSLLRILLEISQAVDLINPQLAAHHSRVAYIAYQLAQTLGLDEPSQKMVTMAGALHDIGVLSIEESRKLAMFEVESKIDHGEIGYLFLNGFAPLACAGDLIRSHHMYWNDGAGEQDHSCGIPLASHLIHLADRVAVSIDPSTEILMQMNPIRERIAEQSGRMFVPRFVEAFLDLSAKEFFWLDAVTPDIGWRLAEELQWETLELNGKEFHDLARLFCHIVDFKSPFTAAHSSGVAASAHALGRLAGLSAESQEKMLTAGYLHDIGKLSVPLEILEKPAALDPRETAVIRHHSYQTFQILQRIGLDEEMRSWSAYHHERLDGSGYPFHIDAEKLSMGSRVMSVADVFTALVENRPYRAGLPRSGVMPILNSMVSKGWLDGDLVQTLSANFDEMNALCLEAEENAAQEYQSFARAKENLPMAV